jgi:hypothetical protein
MREQLRHERRDRAACSGVVHEVTQMCLAMQGEPMSMLPTVSRTERSKRDDRLSRIAPGTFAEVTTQGLRLRYRRAWLATRRLRLQ